MTGMKARSFLNSPRLRNLPVKARLRQAALLKLDTYAASRCLLTPAHSTARYVLPCRWSVVRTLEMFLRCTGHRVSRLDTLPRGPI